MQNRGIIFILLIPVLIALSGCASKAKFVKPEAQWAPPRSIAVLIFANQSNDEDGPVLVRLLFAEQLKGKGYDVQEPQETENKLKDLGITYGGQLASITPQELSQKLGVDGVIYGTVINFDYKVNIMDTTKHVRLNARLVDGWRDDLFWEDEKEQKIFKSRVGALFSGDVGAVLKNVGEDIGRDVVVKAVTKSLKGMLGHPLYWESHEAVRITLKTLPDYRAGYTTPTR